jgi:hypothetical protein
MTIESAERFRAGSGTSAKWIDFVDEDVVLMLLDRDILEFELALVFRECDGLGKLVLDMWELGIGIIFFC